MASSPTPTRSGVPTRLGDFPTLPDALHHAAGGDSGINVYSGRGELLEAIPYRDLAARAAGLARRLLGAGLARGERVGIVAAADGDFAAAFLACHLCGLVPAPLPSPLAFGGRDAYVDHVTRMAVAARAAALLLPPALLDWFPPAHALGLRFRGTVAALDDLPEAGGELRPAGPDEVGYLQFSSGSTRFPLGVAVTQRGLMSNLAAIVEHGLRVRPGDRCVSWLPLYHDMGLVGFFLAPVAAQMSVDWLPTAEFARRPLEWLRLISNNRGTLSFSPSFGFELCVRRLRGAAPDPSLDLGSWRVAGIGGDMIRPHHLDAFADCFAGAGFRREAFVPSYGMAEATLALSFAALDRGARTDPVDLDRLERDGVAAAPDADGPARRRDFVLCGSVLPGHEVQPRDDAGRPLPDRRVGRLFAHGPSLMRGYDGRPEETAAVLSADGWLDTGDLGYRVDGELVITGRAKDLIIVNGRNVWPQDLEWSLEHALPEHRGGIAAIPADADGGTGGEAGDALVVLIEARPSDPAARQALREAAAAALRDAHGLDGRVVLVARGALPHTSSGKLSRARAREMFHAGRFSSLEPEAIA